MREAVAGSAALVSRELSTPEARPHRADGLAAGVAAATAVWLATLVRPTLSNGDAACYLAQLLQADLTQRTVHLGYLATALPWIRLEVLEPATRLNLVSVAWGVIAVVALLRLERLLSPGRLPGWGAIWWLGCTPVLAALSTAEVYPAQAALLLLALGAWGIDRPARAGLWWCLALSVSPTSAAALPAFLFHRAERRAWARFLAIGLLPMALLVAIWSDDYLEGPRGLLHAPAGMSLAEALWYRGTAFPATLGLGLLPLGAGLLVALDGRWPAGRRLLAAMVLQAVSVWLLVDRFGDVPAQGLTLTLLTLVTGEGTGRLVGVLSGRLEARRAWAVVGLLASLHLVAADQAVRAQRRREADFAALCRRVYAALGPDGRVTGTFSERRLYEWYATGQAPAGLTIELEALEAARPDLGGAAGRRPEVRFLSLSSLARVPVGGRVRHEPDGSWSW